MYNIYVTVNIGQGWGRGRACDKFPIT